MKENEKVLIPAIHYDDGKTYDNQPTNIKKGFVLTGFRHNLIYSQLKIIQDKLRGVDVRKIFREIPHTEGFITNKNRFVSREEALIIAVREDQLVTNSLDLTKLYSEDLYL